jgi:hypothetical protein
MSKVLDILNEERRYPRRFVLTDPGRRGNFYWQIESKKHAIEYGGFAHFFNNGELTSTVTAHVMCCSVVQGEFVEVFDHHPFLFVEREWGGVKCIDRINPDGTVDFRINEGWHDQTNHKVYRDAFGERSKVIYAANHANAVAPQADQYPKLAIYFQSFSGDHSGVGYGDKHNSFPGIWKRVHSVLQVDPELIPVAVGHNGNLTEGVDSWDVRTIDKHVERGVWIPYVIKPFSKVRRFEKMESAKFTFVDIDSVSGRVWFVDAVGDVIEEDFYELAGGKTPWTIAELESLTATPGLWREVAFQPKPNHPAINFRRFDVNAWSNELKFVEWSEDFTVSAVIKCDGSIEVSRYDAGEARHHAPQILGLAASGKWSEVPVENLPRGFLKTVPPEIKVPLRTTLREAIKRSLVGRS